MDNLIGRWLGRYHIIEPLGEGGMASVFKAYDTALERFVAVKVIRVEKSQNEAFLHRFQREARALARLDHPFILKVLDYGEQDGMPFLVMPFVAGGTLKARLGQPIPATGAAALLAPVARALEYAHEQGVIHRDIKPANILIGPAGVPLLSDFGIAKMLDQEETSTQITATGVGIGTPDYMAPEQWMGQADQRTDVYALGVVFYEMVTGRRPFTADTPAAVLLKHVLDPLPRPRDFAPDLPVGAEQVLYKALAKNPADRYQTVGGIAAALEAIAAGVAHAVPGADTIETMVETGPRREAAAPPSPAEAAASTVAAAGESAAEEALAGEVEAGAPAAAPAPEREDAAQGAPVELAPSELAAGEIAAEPALQREDAAQGFSAEHAPSELAAGEGALEPVLVGEVESGMAAAEQALPAGPPRKAPAWLRAAPALRIAGIVLGVALALLLLVVGIPFLRQSLQPGPGLLPTDAATKAVVVPPVEAGEPAAPEFAGRPCDEAQLTADITIPHGAQMAPGEVFVKTWRLRNLGSCEWGGGYALAYAEGDRLSGPAAVELPGVVRPGVTVDLSIEMQSPAEPGLYLGRWQLHNPSGEAFGPFFLVEIVVAQPEPAREPAPEIVQAAEEICAKDPHGCARFAPGDTVKIGLGAPLSGENAPYGVDISQAARIAVADGETVLGWHFALAAQDDLGTPEGGAAAARKLASDPGVVAIVGHVFSGAAGAAIPVYEEAAIPMMSPSATSPILPEKGPRVFNRIVYTDEAQGRAAAEYLFHGLGVRKLAVLHSTEIYGQGLSGIVAERFTNLGGEVVAIEPLPPGTDDYKTPLSIVAARNPQAVYYGGYIPEAVILANQWAQSGLKGVIFFGCDGIFGLDFIERTGANGEGVYAAGWTPIFSDAVTRFNDIYQKEYGVPAGSLSPFTWNGYDAAAVLIAAVKQVAFVGPDGFLYVPRSEMVATVRGTRNFAGLSGVITCGEVGECNASGPTFYVVKNGKWLPVEQ